MKITAEVLAAALAVVAPALARGGTEQQAAVHIEPKLGQIILTASGPAATLRRVVTAPEAQPASPFLLKPKVLQAVLSSLGGEVVELLPGDQLTVKSGNPAYTGRFFKLSAEGWSSLADSKAEVTEVKLDGFALADAFRQVGPAVGDPSALLGHVHIHFGTAKSALVTATDGHRAHRATIHLETQLQKAMEVLIPRDAVQALSSVLSAGSAPVTLGISKDRLRLETGDTQLWVLLGEGQFPEVGEVLTQSGCLAKLDRAAVVPRAELLAALRRTALVVNSTPCVRLSFGRHRLELEAQDGGAVASEEVSLGQVCERVEVGVNSDYLKAALEVATGENVRLLATSAEAPVFVAPQEGTDSWALVMPVKLQERA